MVLAHWTCVACPLSLFFCRFMVHNDPCFAHSSNFIGCISAFDKKVFPNFCQFSHVCLIFGSFKFLSFFFLLTFTVFFKRQSLPRSICLMVSEDLTLVLFQFLFFFCRYCGNDSFRYLTSTIKGIWHAYINS